MYMPRAVGLADNLLLTATICRRADHGGNYSAIPRVHGAGLASNEWEHDDDATLVRAGLTSASCSPFGWSDAGGSRTVWRRNGIGHLRRRAGSTRYSPLDHITRDNFKNSSRVAIQTASRPAV